MSLNCTNRTRNSFSPSALKRELAINAGAPFLLVAAREMFLEAAITFWLCVRTGNTPFEAATAWRSAALSLFNGLALMPVETN